MTEVGAIRQAIIDAIPYRTSNYGESPDPRFVYVPPAHLKALRLESNVVIGSRGVGQIILDCRSQYSVFKSNAWRFRSRFRKHSGYSHRFLPAMKILMLTQRRKSLPSLFAKVLHLTKSGGRLSCAGWPLSRRILSPRRPGRRPQPG